MVKVKDLRPTLRWLLAFFRGAQGPLVRTFVRESLTLPLAFTIVTDACPWGMGGVLYEGTRPVTYWADELHEADLLRFGASRGDLAHNTLWEALAALVSFRVWAHWFSVRTPVAYRSDNTGILEALAQRCAPATSLNIIMQEWAIDEAWAEYPIRYLEHIPGVSNTISDALSRLSSPSPSPLPACLRHVPRTVIMPRETSFYRTSVIPASA